MSHGLSWDMLTFVWTEVESKGGVGSGAQDAFLSKRVQPETTLIRSAANPK